MKEMMVLHISVMVLAFVAVFIILAGINLEKRTRALEDRVFLLTKATLAQRSPQYQPSDDDEGVPI